MPDARVIPIASGRGEQAGEAVARGAARASGERARRRRRPTPLLDLPAEPYEPGAGGPDQPAAGLRSGSARSKGRTPPPDAPPVTAVDEAVAEAGEELASLMERGRGTAEWEHRVAALLAFLRRRLEGTYEVDPFGFDPELTDSVLLAALRPLYSHWFRVDVVGLENVPAEGGALVVANHSGTIAFDAMMTQLALLDHHPAHRSLRMLAADLVFTTPVVGELARRSGATLACMEDAERLLRGGELVGVWPEGFKGIGKPFSERYKLQRFGRGGFVAAALRTGTPIMPCSIVGAEEIYPILGNMKTVARILGLPYLPVTPTFPWLGLLGTVPLPSKWKIEFGEPIRTDGHGPAAADDPMLVFNLTDQVRETIQHTLYKLLMQRRSVFF